MCSRITSLRLRLLGLSLQEKNKTSRRKKKVLLKRVQIIFLGLCSVRRGLECGHLVVPVTPPPPLPPLSVTSLEFG